MSHALLPGSYDPMTLGHLDIVKRARLCYDKVTVAVMVNEQKKYTCSLEERVKIAKLTLASYPDVEVIGDEGMLVDLFDRVGADVIVKGIRNDRDREYEEKMAAFNLAHNPRAKTVYMEAADDFEDVSSTRVRELLSKGESVEGLLADEVIDYLKSK